MTSRVQQLGWDRLAATELDPILTPTAGDPVLSILDMMPDALADEADVKDLAWCIDKQLGKLFNRIWLSSPLTALGLISSGRLNNAISGLPGDIFNELAYNFALGAEDVIWFAPHLAKQALLAEGYKLQKKAGTKWALNWIFSLLDMQGQIIPWYSETAAANTFRVLFTSDANGKSYTQIVSAVLFWVDRFAPKGSQLYEIRYTPNGTTNVVLWP